jgi:hypothetical protein
MPGDVTTESKFDIPFVRAGDIYGVGDDARSERFTVRGSVR